MSRFIDLYLDDCVPGYPVFAAPRFATEIVMVDSGDEQVNQRWSNPLHRYTLPEAVRSMQTFNAIRDHWLICGGPARTFPFRDPLDFASVALSTPNEAAPVVGPYDQALGVGDGANRFFQLTKRYTRGAYSYDRTLTCPVVSSIRIAEDPDGASPPFELLSGFSVDRESGIVTFDTAPGSGHVLTWGGYFDVPVRFESDDSFDGIVRTFGAAGFADVVLLEVRGC